MKLLSLLHLHIKDYMLDRLKVRILVCELLSILKDIIELFRLVHAFLFAVLYYINNYNQNFFAALLIQIYISIRLIHNTPQNL